MSRRQFAEGSDERHGYGVVCVCWVKDMLREETIRGAFYTGEGWSCLTRLTPKVGEVSDFRGTSAGANCLKCGKTRR